jgi:hypothetical protein
MLLLAGHPCPPGWHRASPKVPRFRGQCRATEATLRPLVGASNREWAARASGRRGVALLRGVRVGGVPEVVERQIRARRRRLAVGGPGHVRALAATLDVWVAGAAPRWATPDAYGPPPPHAANAKVSMTAPETSRAEKMRRRPPCPGPAFAFTVPFVLDNPHLVSRGRQRGRLRRWASTPWRRDTHEFLFDILGASHPSPM